MTPRTAPLLILPALLLATGCASSDPAPSPRDAAARHPTTPLRAPGQPGVTNPIIPGWYADPEGVVFARRAAQSPAAHKYWIYPTYSAPYNQQTRFDAFSSHDLVTWTKHPNVLTSESVSWARRAMWAPSVIEKDGKFYFFFGANDIQSDTEYGGIGVAVADAPQGPFTDYLGKPLVDRFYNGAQPIDQFVFHDADGAYYLIYGGWRHCNLARLRNDFKGFEPLPNGTLFTEITPDRYVEGPFMFIRHGVYYFMWSEGGWTGPDYSVAYAMADSVHGPFKRIGTVLTQDPAVATGAGHHSVIKRAATDSGDENDEYYIVYHRRPLGEKDANHRVVCIDRLEFDEKGLIKPVKMSGAARAPESAPVAPAR